jgi:hypothetical protein
MVEIVTERFIELYFHASLAWSGTCNHKCMSSKKADIQSGDLQGLSTDEEADSESVRELEDEGQSFEAEAIDAIENAPDPDVAEVTTREVPEDDVPLEYLEDN